MATTTMNIYTFLTSLQIAHALQIWKKNDIPAKEICEKVIVPNLAVIERKIGQKMVPMYLAYAVEYVFNQTEKRR